MEKGFLLLIVYFVVWNTENVNRKLGLRNSFHQHQHVNVVLKDVKRKRFCAPITLYSSHHATFQLIISGDIETNPGPNIRLACTVCEKTVRKNSYHLECKVCRNLSHAKCIHRNFNTKNYKSKCTLWTCHNCLFTELPFCNANLNDCVQPDAERFVADPVPVGSQDHLDILNQHRNQISICHLNIQSMKQSTSQLEAMLARHQFDILTLSET